jgi:hypothetical protein
MAEEAEDHGGETRSTITGATSLLTAPPLNELPALLAAGPLIWRSAGAAIAVLALEVYTSGLEFTITGRIKDQGLARQVQDDARFFARAVTGQGQGELRFSVLCSAGLVHVSSIGGSYDWRGSFRHRAWAETAGDDLTFSLAWPAVGIGYAEHQVTGVRGAAQRAATLW